MVLSRPMLTDKHRPCGQCTHAFNVSQKTHMENTGELILYQTQDGQTKIQVQLLGDTVWLTQAQICELFQKSKATISEHVNNVFAEGELDEKSVVRIFEQLPRPQLQNLTKKAN